MSCYCELEPADVWVVTKLRARKPWKCGDCSGAIKPGEFYNRASCLFDARWSTLRRCTDCAVVACDLRKLENEKKLPNFCFCYSWGGMAQAVFDAWDWSAEYHAALRPIIGAFNAASKERGGITIRVEEYGKGGGE